MGREQDQARQEAAAALAAAAAHGVPKDSDDYKLLQAQQRVANGAAQAADRREGS